METVLEILKYTLPAVVVLLTAYLLVNSALKHITSKIELERRLGMQKDTLPLRLQAYERLTIFLERNQVSGLALRLADDMAYGAGVWVGSVRAGTLEPLLPEVTSWPKPSRYSRWRSALS